MSLLKRSEHYLHVLSKANKKTFETILEETKILELTLKCLKEICVNILYTTIEFTKEERKKLRKIKPFILSLANGSTTGRQKQNKLSLLLQNRDKARLVLDLYFKTIIKYV